MALTTTPDSLSPIPGTSVVEGEVTTGCLLCMCHVQDVFCACAMVKTESPLLLAFSLSYPVSQCSMSAL